MFEAFPKIVRLNRDCVITEKIDGTNAAIFIDFHIPGDVIEEEQVIASQGDNLVMYAQSRSRLIRPGKTDNAGFAGWVYANSAELFKLGCGRHFGEWWGGNIQRGYGLKEKKFSLFNVGIWNGGNVPSCVGVVPTLYKGVFDTVRVGYVLSDLKKNGSAAAPGFMNPEGIVVFHTAANQLFKVTCENDERPKGLL